jgi:hypothetical protein
LTELAHAGKATVQRILEEQELKPHRTRYYRKRRDPDLETKMCQVLLVFRELSWRRDTWWRRAENSVGAPFAKERDGVAKVGCKWPAVNHAKPGSLAEDSPRGQAQESVKQCETNTVRSHKVEIRRIPLRLSKGFCRSSRNVI